MRVLQCKVSSPPTLDVDDVPVEESTSFLSHNIRSVTVFSEPNGLRLLITDIASDSTIELQFDLEDVRNLLVSVPLSVLPLVFDGLYAGIESDPPYELQELEDALAGLHGIGQSVDRAKEVAAIGVKLAHLMVSEV